MKRAETSRQVYLRAFSLAPGRGGGRSWPRRCRSRRARGHARHCARRPSAQRAPVDDGKDPSPRRKGAKGSGDRFERWSSASECSVWQLERVGNAHWLCVSTGHLIITSPCKEQPPAGRLPWRPGSFRSFQQTTLQSPVRCSTCGDHCRRSTCGGRLCRRRTCGGG